MHFQFDLDIMSEFYLLDKTSSDLISVNECYKKSPTHHYTHQQVASWSHSNGLVMTMPKKFERRSNLTGVTFEITAFENVNTDAVIKPINSKCNF